MRRTAGGLAHGGANTRVGHAAAEIAGHLRIDVGIPDVGIVLEDSGGLHDLAGLAVATLRHLQVLPGFLDGVELAVKVTPRAGRNRVEGVVIDAAGAAWIVAKVSVPAEGGKANRAVLALLAEGLGVAATGLELVAGAGSRWKRVRVAGDPAHLASRAEALTRA